MKINVVQNMVAQLLQGRDCPFDAANQEPQTGTNVKKRFVFHSELGRDDALLLNLGLRSEFYNCPTTAGRVR